MGSRGYTLHTEKHERRFIFRVFGVDREVFVSCEIFRVFFLKKIFPLENKLPQQPGNVTRSMFGLI